MFEELIVAALSESALRKGLPIGLLALGFSFFLFPLLPSDLLILSLILLVLAILLILANGAILGFFSKGFTNYESGEVLKKLFLDLIENNRDLLTDLKQFDRKKVLWLGSLLVGRIIIFYALVIISIISLNTVVTTLSGNNTLLKVSSFPELGVFLIIAAFSSSIILSEYIAAKPSEKKNEMTDIGSKLLSNYFVENTNERHRHYSFAVRSLMIFVEIPLGQILPKTEMIYDFYSDERFEDIIRDFVEEKILIPTNEQKYNDLFSKQRQGGHGLIEITKLRAPDIINALMSEERIRNIPTLNAQFQVKGKTGMLFISAFKACIRTYSSKGRGLELVIARIKVYCILGTGKQNNIFPIKLKLLTNCNKFNLGEVVVCPEKPLTSEEYS